MVRRRSGIRCHLTTPGTKDFEPVIHALKEASKTVSVKLTWISIISQEGSSLLRLASSLTACDLVIADVSHSNKPNVFYEIGIAHSMGKPVIFLFEESGDKDSFGIITGQFITYRNTTKGLEQLKNTFCKIMEDFLRSPRRFRSFAPFPIIPARLPYIIELDKLEPRDFENLCFELLTQMGFRRFEWGKGVKEIDAVATLPKKDPDGYEYQELWFISMGLRAPVERMLELSIHEPEYLFHRIFRSLEQRSDFLYKFQESSSITILIILKHEMGRDIELLERDLIRTEKLHKERSPSLNLRIRFWDRSYLTNLIQQYPQIGFKYFSEEARVKSKHRKTQEELYLENVELNEKLQAALNQLEEEKKKRFIAEREAAWKDVAFKAAHKLGNPIDAIETYLQSMALRIKRGIDDEALKIVKEMDVSIEEAKSVIAQFKSLTRSQEIEPSLVKLLPLVEHASQVAKENGIMVEINIPKNCPKILVDPVRLTECFSELIANSSHWFDKDEKRISISAKKATKRELPESLDASLKYLKIVFEDNGCGVSFDEKEKIFSAFYTTYPHGSGLGLALVKWIIDAHDGLINEDGKQGQGAKFYIYLPFGVQNKKDS
ncbi:MAG: sensor histidine kinase [Planctomycetota bacterium]|jgi:signal transduction histidine kinase